MSAPSLQRRLSWLIGVPVVALWLLTALWMGHRIDHESAEMFDRELERTAASVLAVLASSRDDAGLRAGTLPGDEAEEGARPEIVVRDRAGRLLLDASVLPPLVAGDGDAHFHTLAHAGTRWRIYQRWDERHRHWIQVAAPLHDRDELMRALVRASLVPLAGLLLLLPLATWLGLRRGLAPLRALSQAIHAQPARTPVLTCDAVPVELRQLTRALDALVAHLDAALARERRFTADAAHELRHPLSVLRMELDLAGARVDDAGRREHLQRARDGLARMERLVAQLLVLARVESLDRLDGLRSVSPATLAREVLAEAGERAAPRGVTLSLQADEALRVRGSPELLAIAVRNLVDNAIGHGRPGGQVGVRVEREDGAVALAVDDDGPGFEDAQAARVGERFARGEGGGSGLGLSIAQAVAALHGGGLVVGHAPAGGARVVLRLPLAPPA